jgi:membrane-associated phospholipid phosphatase
MGELRATWKSTFSKPALRRQAIISVALLIAILQLAIRFFNYIETRPGVVISDPILNWIPAMDLTWLAFALIYGGFIIVIPALIKRPDRLVFGMQAYVTLVIFRMGAMYLLPLDPPPGMIILRDPVVQNLLNTGEPLTRDLFFSGHTSTMFLLYHCALNPKVKTALLIGTVGIGACVILQHVHYSVDVLAAPFFAYCAVRVATFTHERLR